MKFITEIDDDVMIITGYKGELPEVLEIPDTIDNFPVVEIAEGVFSNGTKLRKVIMPGTMQVIQPEAFKNQSNLQEVEFQHSCLAATNAFAGTKYDRCNEDTVCEHIERPKLLLPIFFG